MALKWLPLNIQSLYKKTSEANLDISTTVYNAILSVHWKALGRIFNDSTDIFTSNNGKQWKQLTVRRVTFHAYVRLSYNYIY